MSKSGANPVRARGGRNRHAELTLRFGFDRTCGVRHVAHARSFIALWRDQFGTVHFTATADWDDEMRGIGLRIREAYAELASER
jgi:hypothetical protein